MKIQCDVCSRDEASVFCCADEAALCDACDHRVHLANKLSSKHRRFSLSSADQTQPLCDICKERRGFVFCQEDRAILCGDCDHPIHAANQLTMKHNRFLLPGARLLPMSLSSTSPLKQGVVDQQSQEETNHKKVSVVEELSVNTSPISATPPSNGNNNDSSSSISEYLIKTLPGYHVEDLLVHYADGLYKNDEMVPFLEFDLVGEEQFLIWAPHHGSSSSIPEFSPHWCQWLGPL